MHSFNLDSYQSSIPYPILPSNDRRDERSDSQSDSEDSHGHLVYPQPQKSDIDLEDDANAALTSQTLNADGTPKRPMNAFMIFARRRRPQVSAENQSMRTGEISKILSKEWNSMEMTDKQFYLDQAKQLKDTFNNKYPDYVYRRRPNNSRKKRRTEGGVNRSYENLLPNDNINDISGSEIYGEPSPIEAQDNSLGFADPAYSRISFGDHNGLASHLKNPAYNYPVTAELPRHVGSQETRMPHISTISDRISRRVPSINPVASNRLTESQYPYIRPQNQALQAQSSIPYTTEQSTADDNWDSRVGSGRFVSSNWNASQQRCLVGSSTPKLHSYASADPAQTSSWSAGTAPPVDSSPHTNASQTTQTANYPFPTLNSPFYPQAIHIEGNFQNNTTASSGSALQYNNNTTQNHLQGGPTSTRNVPQYDNHTYVSPPSVRYPTTFVSDSDRDGHLYQQPQPRPALPRPLPSLQSIAPFTQLDSSSSPPNPNIHHNTVSSQPAFWSRDRLE